MENNKPNKRAEYIFKLITEFELKRDSCISPYCDMNEISEVELLSGIINSLKQLHYRYIRNYKAKDQADN